MIQRVVDVLLGLQWGDEGKGKIVDTLATEYDMIARFQGGPNAGHTLIVEGKKLVLHTIPSGILQDQTINLIGNGVVLDPYTFKKEIEALASYNIDFVKKLFISKKANLILPTHMVLDAASEAAKGEEKIGSTLRGIGPSYMDKTGRNGLRVGDINNPDFQKKYDQLKVKHLRLLQAYDFEFDLSEAETEFWEGIEMIREMSLVDSEYLVNEFVSNGRKILAEGAQGSMLDNDFGTYPFVTSSNTISAAACTGLGIPPQSIGEVIGISKAYSTRVGSGPFPTELFNEIGEKLRKSGGEFGATTGRPRRCGWIDIPALKYSIMLNGVTQLVLTKVDVLDSFEQIEACAAYEINGRQVTQVPHDLNDVEIRPIYKTFKGWGDRSQGELVPQALTEYLNWLEAQLDTRISILSTGPGREELLRLPLANTLS